MKKLKVLQVLEATIGGTRTHLNQLVNHLDKSKFDITVICSTLREPDFSLDISRWRRDGINVLSVDMVRGINIFKDLLAFIEILWIIKRGKYDIVHTHSSKAGCLGRLAARLTHIQKIYYTPHAFAFQAYSNGLRRIFYLSIERILTKITNKIICVSESEKNLAIRYGVADLKKIIVISNAINIPKINIKNSKIMEKLGINNDKIIIGTVGNFCTQKGYKYIIEAAAKVINHFDDVIFIIIGDGNERSYIEKMINFLQLENKIILTGHVQHEEMLNYYAIMDIFVLASLWEGMPYSILEAMSIGKPIIATDVPGTRDIVVHNETGKLVPPRDSLAISKSLHYLLKEPKQRNKLGKAAQQLMVEQYQIKQRIFKIEALYQNYH
jgi:glycosyltransferase involved in cell wall biosynthesis